MATDRNEISHSQLLRSASPRSQESVYHILDIVTEWMASGVVEWRYNSEKRIIELNLWDLYTTTYDPEDQLLCIKAAIFSGLVVRLVVDVEYPVTDFYSRLRHSAMLENSDFETWLTRDLPATFPVEYVFQGIVQVEKSNHLLRS